VPTSTAIADARRFAGTGGDGLPNAHSALAESSQCRNTSMRADSARHDEFIECPCVEETIRMQIATNRLRRTRYVFVNLVELRGARPRALTHQRTRQSSQNSLRPIAVNMRIGPIQVAQGLRQPVRSSLEHEPFMLRVLAERDGEPQLERHIESGRGRRHAVKRHTRQIVERVTAGTKEMNDAVESPLTA
jgi:hypothetical protein